MQTARHNIRVTIVMTGICAVAMLSPAHSPGYRDTFRDILLVDPPHITHRRMSPYAGTAGRMHDLSMPRLHKPAEYSPHPLVHLGMPVNFVFEMEAASMPQCFHHTVPTTQHILKHDLFPETDLAAPTDYDNGKFKALVKKTRRGELEGFVHVALVWGEQLRVPENCRRAMIGLAEGIRTYTDLEVTVDSHLILSSLSIHGYPMLVITADSAFELTPTERDNLRTYIENGGFLFVDNARPEFPHGQAEASLRKMMRDVLGCHARFEPIPVSHDIYHSYFDFNDGPPIGNEVIRYAANTTGIHGVLLGSGKLNEYSYYLECVTYKNRLVCIYSDRGYTISWSGLYLNNLYIAHDGFTHYEKGESRPQLKFGVNLVVYVLKKHTLPMPKYDVVVTDW